MAKQVVTAGNMTVQQSRDLEKAINELGDQLDAMLDCHDCPQCGDPTGSEEPDGLCDGCIAKLHDAAFAAKWLKASSDVDMQG